MTKPLREAPRHLRLLASWMDMGVMEGRFSEFNRDDTEAMDDLRGWADMIEQLFELGILEPKYGGDDGPSTGKA